MAFPVTEEGFGAVSEHVPVPNVMEPEAVIRDSDEDEPESPSTPGSKRKASHSASGVLKRTMSSPTVLGLGVEGVALSAADKKRNKLGYHRTAVACGKADTTIHLVV